KTQFTIKNNLFIRTNALAALDSQPPPPQTRGPVEAPVHWIWYDEGDPGKDAPPGHVYFRKSFVLPKGAKIASALLEACCDDSCTIWLNGNTWKSPVVKLADKRMVAFNVASYLQTKPDADAMNWIAVQGTNDHGPAGLLLQLSYTLMGNPAKH